MSYIFDLVKKNKESLKSLYYDKKISSEHLINYTKGSIKVCEAQAIYSVIVDKGYKNLIDIGTGPGFSCLYMAQAIKTLGLSPDNSKVYSYDIVRSKQTIAKLNLEKFDLTGYVKFFCVDAPKALKAHEDNSFDFVLIDGNHGYDSVVKDFEQAERVVRPGGCIAFDDCFPRPPENPGPRQIVDSLISEGKNVEFVGDDIFDIFSYQCDRYEAQRLHNKWMSKPDSFCVKEKANPKEVLAFYFVE
tara:strand:- start:2797 stop:3531 length:735 start_codon:yes stop_codon:yes gene_type:complete